MLIACVSGHLEVLQWLFGAGAAEDMRTADEDGGTPMLTACINGHLEVVQWLFGAGAAEDVRTADNSGWTPMFIGCLNGHLVVVQGLICNGAANNTSIGHIDASFMATLRRTGRLPALQSAISAHITNHSNFTTLILPAVCSYSQPFNIP